MPDADTTPPSSADSWASASTLGFIAYVMFPTLAVVTAVFGTILVTRDNLAAGLAFFALLQLWVVGGIVVHIRRKRLVQSRSRHDDGESSGTATE